MQTGEWMMSSVRIHERILARLRQLLTIEYSVDFLVNFYCIAPDGGPAHGNVTWNGCMQYFLLPWWGNDLVVGHGPCAELQGKLIKVRT